MSMYKIQAVFRKQIKDTIKNKMVLINFILLPLMAVIFENAIVVEDLPPNYFVKMFATMYLGMSPLTAMASVISEEKEKCTLKALLMADVKGTEYLIGIGSSIFAASMLGAAVFGITGKYGGKELVQFLFIMGIGILTSLLLGAAIGAWSKNQMAATSITVPVMMIFSFLPLIAIFNTKVERVASITYSQQISVLMNNIGVSGIDVQSVTVIGLNILAVVILFSIAYKKL